ncbi:MAG: hypothetical protein JEZ00_15300 [Anaerolineaceae bacterium]|nr:hypothetical protein [Anaerolineaceae bacterium]
MLNLYWKSKEQTSNLLLVPFQNEKGFESYIFQNQDLLPDIYVLYRQIRTGSKQGIPDMLGVDQDSRICIIEMKNVEVGEEIFPQVLTYAMWAETNPDSIKAIWLEANDRPEDIKIEWDALEVRIIVVAPSFKSNVLKLSSKINYPLDLVQVRRFCQEDNEFVIVETLEDMPMVKPTTTKVMGDWTWDYYESEHGKEPTQEFKKAVTQLDGFVKNQGWNLPYNLNKYYTGFKFGNKVVFDVSWESTKTWSIHMKIPPKISETFLGKVWKYHKYDATFKNSMFRLLPGEDINISELSEMLKAAYRNVSGI